MFALACLGGLEKVQNAQPPTGRHYKYSGRDMWCGSQHSPIRNAKKIIKLFSFSHKFHSMIAIFILSLLWPGPGKANSELENRIKGNHRTQITLRKAKGEKNVIMSRLSYPTEPFSDTHPVSSARVRRLLKWKNRKNPHKKRSPRKFASIFNLWHVVSERPAVHVWDCEQKMNLTVLLKAFIEKTPK